MSNNKIEAQQQKNKPTNNNVKEKINNAPKEQSFDEYLASLWGQTINDLKKEVSASYKNINAKINSAISIADKSIKEIQALAISSIDNLGKECAQIVNDIKTWANEKWITSISFLKDFITWQGQLANLPED